MPRLFDDPVGLEQEVGGGAEKNSTSSMCPAIMLAMRRMASVKGRRRNVDTNSIGTTEQ